jgi:DNA-binding CsgD family transcriptional regulator
MTNPVPASVARPRPTWPLLTDKQQTVLELLAEGCTVRQIASRMYLSEHTVATHQRRMRAALGAVNPAHAVAIGYQTGLLGSTR